MEGKKMVGLIRSKLVDYEDNDVMKGYFTNY